MQIELNSMQKDLLQNLYCIVLDSKLASYQAYVQVSSPGLSGMMAGNSKTYHHRKVVRFVTKGARKQ